VKPALQLKLGQHLTLTPQLRQAIRLLQLSSIELDQEITTALESNPLLERPEDAEPVPETTAEGETPERTEAQAAELPKAEEPAEEFNPEHEWPEDDYSSGSGSGSNNSDDGERESVAGAITEDLQDHLLWQLNLTPMSARDRNIGVAIIEGIGEDGYLSESIEAIQAALRPEIEAGPAEIEAVLHRIQRFDPLGVAARSLSESLLVQLSALAEETEGLALAKRIVDGHLEALAKLGPDKLGSQLGADPEDMHCAVSLVRSLDPRPGSQIASSAPDYVSPDAYAYRHNGVWKVALAPGCRPQLGINRHYESLIARAGKGDAAYLRGQLQEARWLIKSLMTRADTVQRVAGCIVKHQTGFLEHGPEAMRPLVLREVADELGLHESTISRVTTRKYLHTPRGTFEFKHFFSSSLATTDGGSASSTAIQAMIKRLIEQEDPRRPLSDARLADDLKAAGITVARRTVAKYREAMNIPSSNERQRLA
jgi:RNA polymerase sigma-54 factor